MENQRKILIGMNHSDISDMIEEMLELFIIPEGYSVQKASNLDEMLGLISENPEAMGYIMDANLENKSHGGYASEDPSSRIEVYKIIKDRISSHKAALFVMSGKPITLDHAVEAGMPREYTLEKPFCVMNLLRKLDSIE